MASPKKAVWNGVGRPFTVAAPIVYTVNYCVRNKIGVLGTIGNDDHLNAEPPEDHCPFSDTAWPNRLPLTTPVAGQRYWVCAGDFANERAFGAHILRDARAGQLPWLKYMNAAGMHYTFADGFREGRPNTDQHVHLSTFDDPDSLQHDCTGWDPLAGPPPREDIPMRLYRDPTNGAVYLSDGISARWLRDTAELQFYRRTLTVNDNIEDFPAGFLTRLVVVGAKPPGA